MNPVLMTTDWSPTIRRAARVVGTVAALLITLAWIAGDASYAMGRQLRAALDARNDQLAAWWVGVLGVAPAATAAPVASDHPAPVVPIALLPAAATSLKVPSKPAPRKRRAPAAKPAPAKPRAKAPKARRKVAA